MWSARFKTKQKKRATTPPAKQTAEAITMERRVAMAAKRKSEVMLRIFAILIVMLRCVTVGQWRAGWGYLSDHVTGVAEEID